MTVNTDASSLDELLRLAAEYAATGASKKVKSAEKNRDPLNETVESEHINRKRRQRHTQNNKPQAPLEQRLLQERKEQVHASVNLFPVRRFNCK